MPHPPRLFPGNEELGKRDDDHKRRSKRSLAVSWFHHRIFLRRSYKRIFWGLVVLVGLYFFLKYMPTDLEPRANRPNYGHTSAAGENNRWSNSETGKHKEASEGEGTPSATEVPDEADAETEHWFNGPIKYYDLASSLNAIAKNTKGGGLSTRHVLFAASNVKSAGILLPLACEMANFKRNDVHFAFMGRDDISIDLLKQVNGVKAGCDVWFHGMY
jgi:hypothetical protein